MGIKTYVKGIDDILGRGLVEGGINVLVAPTGSYKTTTLQIIANNITKFGNKDVLFINFEDDFVSMAARGLKINESYGKYSGYENRGLVLTRPNDNPYSIGSVIDLINDIGDDYFVIIDGFDSVEGDVEDNIGKLRVLRSTILLSIQANRPVNNVVKLNIHNSRVIRKVDCVFSMNSIKTKDQTLIIVNRIKHRYFYYINSKNNSSTKTMILKDYKFRSLSMIEKFTILKLLPFMRKLMLMQKIMLWLRK